MRRILSALLTLLLLFHAAAATARAQSQAAAKIVQPSTPDVQQQQHPLTNADVLKLSEAKVAPEVVIEKIKASACDFDTSPEALRGLKDAGVPDSLLLVMVMSPRCAP